MPLFNQDFRIQNAEAAVLQEFGDVVSVRDKAKALNKFGFNTTVGSTFETVAQLQGTTANETFVSTNLIDSISSSSGSDTTQTITIEGHTIDGSGNFTFVTQDAVLNGQTKVTLSTPLARANRAFVKATGTAITFPIALAGTVYIYDDTDGITAGVPDTAAATKLMIMAGEAQSEKCATAISSQDYWFITELFCGLGVAGGPSADRVEFRIERRDVANGGAWRQIGGEVVVPVGGNPQNTPYIPYLIIPKNHDVRLRAKTNASTAACYGEIQGYLALVVS